MQLLLVDDQTNVLDSLLVLVDWKKLGFTKTHTAANADQARTILDSESIDVLITDIEMPGEDGLSLYKWTKDTHPDTECVFLTCHADFEYAKEAIRLGGFGYILQPATGVEIETVIRGLLLKMKQKSRHAYLERMSSAISQQRDDILDANIGKLLEGKVEDALDYLCKYEFLPAEDGPVFNLAFAFLIRIVKWHKNKAAWDDKLLRSGFANVAAEVFFGKHPPPRVKFIVSSQKNGGGPEYWGFIFTQNWNGTNGLKEKAREFFDIFSQARDFSIAVYVSAIPRQDITQAIHTIQETASDNVIKSAEMIDCDNITGPPSFEGLLYPRQAEKWAELIKRGDFELLEKEITQLLDDAKQRMKLTLRVMKEVKYHIIRALNLGMEYNYSSGFDIGYFIGELKLNETDYCEFMEDVKVCLAKALKLSADENAAGDHIDAALAFIEKNLCKELTRSQVAGHIYLNEDYFSRAFKKKVGKGFKDYVTEKRVEYARNLLVSTDFSIGVIAAKAGYDNFSYFAKTFKGITGMTPQEYRAQYKHKIQ
ncbi:MAG: helix-turn-helix domain-containing protein [Clostridiales bacterium]|nr:helix-turn-helix domain-containing protein [Clostridiales bacterium]